MQDPGRPGPGPSIIVIVGTNVNFQFKCKYQFVNAALRGLSCLSKKNTRKKNEVGVAGKRQSQGKAKQRNPCILTSQAWSEFESRSWILDSGAFAQFPRGRDSQSWHLAIIITPSSKHQRPRTLAGEQTTLISLWVPAAVLCLIRNSHHFLFGLKLFKSGKDPERAPSSEAAFMAGQQQPEQRS